MRVQYSLLYCRYRRVHSVRHTAIPDCGLECIVNSVRPRNYARIGHVQANSHISPISYFFFNQHHIPPALSSLARQHSSSAQRLRGSLKIARREYRYLSCKDLQDHHPHQRVQNTSWRRSRKTLSILRCWFTGQYAHANCDAT
jgi:hypothetical protein